MIVGKRARRLPPPCRADDEAAVARRAAVAPSVAPRTKELGAMLPYSPLRHLLLADVGTPLVTTGGNRSDEPIAHHEDDARERLVDIADVLLGHDRPMHARAETPPSAAR